MGFNPTVTTGDINETSYAGYTGFIGDAANSNDISKQCPDGHVVTWQRDYWVYNSVGDDDYEMNGFEFRCSKVELVIPP